MVNYDDMTLKELHEIAEQKLMSNYKKLNKNDLIKLIRKTKISKHPINKFFDRVFVINLWDKKLRLRSIKRQFKKEGISFTRYEAVDGRCKDKECYKKKKIFERTYNVKIKKGLMIPAASLVIGTIEILREMVANKWKRILICEDDVILGEDIKKKFQRGIKTLKSDWDLIYLGCGNKCGLRGISSTKSTKTPHRSQLMKFIDEKIYVKNKLDLRVPCDDEGDCKSAGKYMVKASNPGGTWCYGYSLKGAKKMLKYLDNRINDHIDQELIKAIKKVPLKAFAFDPPIVWHMGGAIRSDSDIPWEW